jgi:hypothetical protein
MDFSSVIQSKMQDIRDGSSEPFLLYRDTNGGWHCDYTQNQYGDTYDWVEDTKAQDPLAIFYRGKDFSVASFPVVYDTMLYDRIKAEYYIARSSGRDSDEIHAMTCFFQDNVGAFSHKFTDYLTTLERPLAVLMEMSPFSLATDHEHWTYNENFAQEAVRFMENVVSDRLSSKFDKPMPEMPSLEGYKEMNKVSVNSSDIILYENPDAEYRYMLVENRFTAYYNESGNNNIYTGFTNDFIEAITEFTDKVQHNANCVQSRRNMRQHFDGVDYVELKNADCLPGSNNDDYTGKLIIAKTSALKPEYRSSENQLLLCTHGNGARPDAIGTSVFCKELLSGNTVVFRRHEIAGITDLDKLPKWAKEKLASEHSKTSQEKEKPAQVPKSKSPPSLLDELDDAKAEAAARSAAKNKTQAKKRDGLEV